MDYVEALLEENEENENHPDKALIDNETLIDDEPLQNQPRELVDHLEGYDTDVKNNNIEEIENENRNDYANDNASQNLEENGDVAPDINSVALVSGNEEAKDDDTTGPKDVQDDTGEDTINNVIDKLESVIDKGRELQGEVVRRSGRETRPVERYTYSQVPKDGLKVNDDKVIVKNFVETAAVMVAVIEGLYI